MLPRLNQPKTTRNKPQSAKVRFIDISQRDCTQRSQGISPNRELQNWRKGWSLGEMQMKKYFGRHIAKQGCGYRYHHKPWTVKWTQGPVSSETIKL